MFVTDWHTHGCCHIIAELCNWALGLYLDLSFHKIFKDITDDNEDNNNDNEEDDKEEDEYNYQTIKCLTFSESQAQAK